MTKLPPFAISISPGLPLLDYVEPRVGGLPVGRLCYLPLLPLPGRLELPTCLQVPVCLFKRSHWTSAKSTPPYCTCLHNLKGKGRQLVMDCRNLISHQFYHPGTSQIKNAGVALSLRYGFRSLRISLIRNHDAFAVQGKDTRLSHVKGNLNRDGESLSKSQATAKKGIALNKKKGKMEHHFWQRRNSAGSGQKALNLVRIISDLPHEKEAVYKALDKWTAWEVEFPLIAAAKALRILKSRSQWLRVIQVAKWMLGKGQGATMATYDTLLLAFDVDGRVDEAESLWNMILHTHTRSISKRLFSRMISLYDHHDMQDKIIEVFADMEELGVKPDEDTVRRIARAFGRLGQEEKRKLFLKRYQSKNANDNVRGKQGGAKSTPTLVSYTYERVTITKILTLRIAQSHRGCGVAILSLPPHGRGWRPSLSTRIGLSSIWLTTSNGLDPNDHNGATSELEAARQRWENSAKGTIYES
ncbi:hypothetical protein NL676_012669 [Syzygium grande]|nr:hypothetical protein NL676_012669 [Syzygium grande]